VNVGTGIVVGNSSTGVVGAIAEDVTGLHAIKNPRKIMKRCESFFGNVFIMLNSFDNRVANGWALAASGQDETTPFCRNQPQATETA
jgi:hypothetical protein